MPSMPGRPWDLRGRRTPVINLGYDRNGHQASVAKHRLPHERLSFSSDSELNGSVLDMGHLYTNTPLVATYVYTARI